MFCVPSWAIFASISSRSFGVTRNFSWISRSRFAMSTLYLFLFGRGRAPGSRRSLLQLLPDRGLFPFPGKLPHLLQKQVGQARIAAVHHQILAVPVLGAALRHGYCAGPRLIVAGDAPIPFLMPDCI